MKWNEKEKREKKWKEMKWIDNEIGNEGAQTLSETLKINTSLTSLNLYCDENEMKWRDRRNEQNENERNE